MFFLPSGRRVGISNIRARYHAARQRLSICEQSPLSRLYRLVDIIYTAGGRVKTIWKEGIDFSGYTLAELDALPDWEAADRAAFRAWLDEAPQQRLIRQAVQRIVCDEFPRVVHEFEYPKRLYSGLQRRLAALDQASAPPLQWRHTLLNLKRQGIREEELQWSGILTWLDQQEADGLARVHHEQLLAALDFSVTRLSLSNEMTGLDDCALSFRDTVQTLSPGQLRYSQLPAARHSKYVLRYTNPIYSYRIGRHFYPCDARSGEQWFVLTPSGKPIEDESGALFHASLERAKAAANGHARHSFGLLREYTPCSRYAHKALCGGEDYREWLLTLPDLPNSYFGSHYYERNLLLHFRTKRRVDETGRRLLFLEELQSDWHQAGATQGYEDRWPGNIPVAPFRHEWVGLALKLLLLHAAEQGFDALAWTPGTIQAAHYDRQLPTVTRLYDQEIPKALLRLTRPWQGRLDQTLIQTQNPWLHARQDGGAWKVHDTCGRFQTRPRFSQHEAMQVIRLHSRRITLEVPMLLLTEELREGLRQHGLPLFGETHQPKMTEIPA